MRSAKETAEAKYGSKGNKKNKQQQKDSDDDDDDDSGEGEEEGSDSETTNSKSKKGKGKGKHDNLIQWMTIQTFQWLVLPLLKRKEVKERVKLPSRRNLRLERKLNKLNW